MCVFFDPSVPKQCREDDADEVKVQDKERANFCDYFKPNASAYDGSFSAGEQKAKGQFADLFGDANESSAADDDQSSEADELFK